ncbi:hypothetical protein RvY_18211-2 [Ramazzottius varieornatus]|nr:hypothetical protein RvY_18211-2 [Ramazzottius varieornatus]
MVGAAKAFSAASFPPAVAKAATLPSLAALEAERTLGPQAASYWPLTQCPAVDGAEGLLDRDCAVQQAPKLCHIPTSTCQPVGTDHLSHLLEEMRQLASTIKSLKLQNSHILTELTAADRTIQATSHSLNVLGAYSLIKDSSQYPS